MTDGHGGDVKRCCGDCAEKQGETDHDQDEHDVGERVADRVAYNARSLVDADLVAHRVKRPIKLLVIRDVEDLVDGEQAEEDPGDRGQNASWLGRQHERRSH